ncbi:hypothetical protein D7D25_10000 [Proteiniphilum sp. X52]|nr:hypothetical protein D7D25_10000 [Proteiniphilum sp. X52]
MFHIACGVKGYPIGTKIIKNSGNLTFKFIPLLHFIIHINICRVLLPSGALILDDRHSIATIIALFRTAV